MTLQFADHSAKKLYGIVKDVLVKIDKFIFPVDFVILEMLEDEEIPLILGRPFLETGRCVINIEERTMKLKAYDKEVKINVRNTMKDKEDICTSHTIEVSESGDDIWWPFEYTTVTFRKSVEIVQFSDNDKENDNGDP